MRSVPKALKMQKQTLFSEAPPHAQKLFGSALRPTACWLTRKACKPTATWLNINGSLCPDFLGSQKVVQRRGQKTSSGNTSTQPSGFCSWGGHTKKKTISYSYDGRSLVSAQSVAEEAFPHEEILDKCHRSNQDTCLIHRPAVKVGEWVESGDLLADNSASMNGELAIGKNIVVAYMPWEGYNYEDAILINERLVYDDVYTSVHIERYEIETKINTSGGEQITRDIPDLHPSATAHLDQHGIASVGSWIEEGSILVGKVTPINKKSQTPYQRLLFKLLDKTLNTVRDSSLRAPKGMKANVIHVQILEAGLRVNQKPSNPQNPGKAGFGGSGGQLSGISVASQNKLKMAANALNSATQAHKPPAVAQLHNRKAVVHKAGSSGAKTSSLNSYAYLKNTKITAPPNSNSKKRGLSLGTVYNPIYQNHLSQNIFYCPRNFSSTANLLAPIDELTDQQKASATGLRANQSVGGKKQRFALDSIGNIVLQHPVRPTKTANTKLLSHSFCPSVIPSSPTAISKKLSSCTRNPLSQHIGLKGYADNTKLQFDLPDTPKWALSLELDKTHTQTKSASKILRSKQKIGGSARKPRPTGQNVFAQLHTHKSKKAIRINNLNNRAESLSGAGIIPTSVHLYLAEKRKIQVGDKMAGRHGNKGIISNILPRQDMPYLPDGTAVDIVLNPLGVPSRMNVGQIYECLLGLAGKYLGEHYKIVSFDEMYGPDASRSFVFSKLFEARQKTGIEWLFDPNSPGKIRLLDGRTSECFDQPITVGIAYMLKLVHMVDDKIHARSVGPYSLVTQQPLRGRAKQGGQRLGEMEVWAIEGYGAAFVLLEMLTLKSDDMTGRLTLWSNIILNKEITVGTPESFKVLVCELQALCLDIGLFRLTSINNKSANAFVNTTEEFSTTAAQKTDSASSVARKPEATSANPSLALAEISHLMLLP